MTTDNKAETKKPSVSKPKSLKSHRKNRAGVISQYFSDCIEQAEKIDKAFLKELGEIA